MVAVDPEDHSTSTAKPLTDLDRRRPGRVDNVSPALIPLLRGQISQEALNELDPRLGNPDQLSAIKGIATAVGVSAFFWAAVAWVVRR